MKISVNLATVASSRERYALAWAVPLALFAVAALVLLTVSAARNYIEYRKIQKDLSEHFREDEQLREREAALKRDLDQPKEREVFKKVDYVNGLINRKELSLVTLTEKVAKLLPSTVRLSSMALAQSKEDMVVRLTVAGQNLEGLESFLGKLEDSPDFKDFTVSPQGFQPAGNAGGLVSIICSVRYVGAGKD